MCWVVTDIPVWQHPILQSVLFILGAAHCLGPEPLHSHLEPLAPEHIKTQNCSLHSGILVLHNSKYKKKLLPWTIIRWELPVLFLFSLSYLSACSLIVLMGEKVMGNSSLATLLVGSSLFPSRYLLWNFNSLKMSLTFRWALLTKLQNSFCFMGNFELSSAISLPSL